MLWNFIYSQFITLRSFRNDGINPLNNLTTIRILIQQVKWVMGLFVGLSEVTFNLILLIIHPWIAIMLLRITSMMLSPMTILGFRWYSLHLIIPLLMLAHSGPWMLVVLSWLYVLTLHIIVLLAVYTTWVRVLHMYLVYTTYTWLLGHLLFVFIKDVYLIFCVFLEHRFLVLGI